MFGRTLITWIYKYLWFYSFAYVIISFLLLDYYQNIQSGIIFLVSLILCGLTYWYLMRVLDELWRKKHAAENQR